MTDLAETRYAHIVLGPGSTPVIAGSGMKVVELVLSHIAYGWSPEELHHQFPHISLGAVHSALAYYWDHREALDRAIERRLDRVDALSSALPAPPVVRRLREKGLI